MNLSPKLSSPATNIVFYNRKKGERKSQKIKINVCSIRQRGKESLFILFPL